jgi:thiamine monophosphate kinase
MIPTTEQFRAYCEKFQEDSRHLSLHVGEDYVLLGTVPVKSAARLQEALESNGCQFHSIGNTVAESGLRLEGSDGSVEVIGASGWDHFR